MLVALNLTVNYLLSHSIYQELSLVTSSIRGSLTYRELVRSDASLVDVLSKVRRFWLKARGLAASAIQVIIYLRSNQDAQGHGLIVVVSRCRWQTFRVSLSGSGFE